MRISPSRLHELLHYDPNTGKLFWLDVPAVYQRVRGKEAFTSVGAGGYRVGRVEGGFYLAHRVIWAMQTGRWPEEVVDHINHNKLDNSWSNLRSASISQNTANRKIGLGLSKFVGVTKRKDTGRWVAQIKRNGRHISLGCFDSEVEAATAYNKAALEVHGEFAHINPV